MHTPARTIACALLLALTAAGCSDGPSGPGEDPPLSVTLAPAATDAVTRRVFGRVDNLRVQIWSDGLRLDSAFAATPRDGSVQWRWPLPDTTGDREMQLRAEARMGTTVLFSAWGSASIQNGVVSAAFQPLDPSTAIRIGPVPPLGLNDTVPLSGALVFLTGDTVPGEELSWGARNSLFEPTVLGVLQGPPPRAIGVREGSARVVATHRLGAYAEQWVSVQSAVASLTVTPDSVDLHPGEKVRLTATARDRRGAALSRSYTWTSTDTAVATVQFGEVTAKAPGSITVTATLQQGMTATSRVRVLP